MSANEKLDLYDWIYWGPHDVLKSYFKNEKSLKEPVIRVKLGHATQNEIFKKSNFIQDLKASGLKKVQITNSAWGEYPVKAIQGEINKENLYICMVGLNTPEGWTLKFQLIFPSTFGIASKNDLQLWQNFISNTKQLSEQDFLKAHGQDLQDGFSLINCNGSTMKVIAEKRNCDNKILVIVIPSDGIEFELHKITDGLLGTEWNYGKSLVKVHGNIMVTKGNSTTVINQVSNVLLKTVSEYSVDVEAIKLKKGVVVYQDP